MENTLTCLKDIISNYEKNSPQPKKEAKEEAKVKEIKYTDNDFEWIKFYCDYTFINDELHCVNIYGNKLLIPKIVVKKFTQSSHWTFKITIINNFSKSNYNFKFTEDCRILQTKINDIIVEFYEAVYYPSCKPILKLIDSNYVMELEVIKHSDKLFVRYDDMELALQNFNEFIRKCISSSIAIFSKYVIDFNNIKVSFDEIKIIGKFKCEFNEILVKKFGNDVKYIDFSAANKILQSVTQEIDPLDEQIYEQSKVLSALITQRNENKEMKKYYEQRKIARSNYSKCMEEIKNIKFVDYEKLLPGLHCDTQNKLIKIWTCRTFAEFEKVVSLTEFESNVAKYLYSLSECNRERKLLENVIYL